MAILVFKKGENAILSPNFKSNEFDCPCPQCTETVVDTLLFTGLEKIRSQAGPLKINSGYRCQHYQDELTARGYQTATGISQHTLGRAADIAREGMSGGTLGNIAISCGFKAVGFARDWIHVDLRDDKDRRWVYTK